MEKEKLSFNINEINEPYFVKDLNYHELKDLSCLIREEIIDVTSKTGGHLSSNLGVVELTIALHRHFDFKKDKLLFDVGHQCYTHKILTGRSIKNIRQDNGLCGFQKMSESPFDQYEAGHSSTAISVATGLALSRDNESDYAIVCVVGDGSMPNGLNLEALNHLASLNKKVIIILNDNDMSISKSSGGFAKFIRKIRVGASYIKHKNRFYKVMNKTRVGAWFYKVSRKAKNKIKSLLVPLTLFDNLGYAYLGPFDGHSFKALDKAIIAAKKTEKSVVLHVKTIKGKGYKPAENDQDGSWHGVTPFIVESGEFIKKENESITWSNLVATKIDTLLEKNNDLYLITSATQKGSCLNEVEIKYPNRTFDVGIAEEHAVTSSSGICLNNKKVIISMYSTFLQRTYDEIHHDIARLNLKPIFVVDRCGLVGQDGATHQGIYDEAFVYTIPNTFIAMPSDANDVSYLLDFGLHNNFNGPIFIRYPRGYCLDNNDNFKYDYSNLYLSRTLLESSNKENLLICVGPHSNELVNIIKSNNFDIQIELMLFVKPIDEEIIKKALNYKNVIVYNPYATEHGFVNAFKAKLLDSGFKNKIHSFAVPNEFIKYGSYNTQLKDLNLTPNQIFEYIKNL